MPTLFRYLMARRFLTRHLGKRAVRFLPGGWITFLVYPIARWAWRRRMKRMRALTPRTS
ncbi:MAG: hypothetical protein ACJ76V_08970 [Thermoleophilaceae bacterium]